MYCYTRKIEEYVPVLTAIVDVVLWFEFGRKIVQIPHQSLSCCWAVLTLSKGHFSLLYHPACEELGVHKEIGGNRTRTTNQTGQRDISYCMVSRWTIILGRVVQRLAEHWLAGGDVQLHCTSFVLKTCIIITTINIFLVLFCLRIYLLYLFFSCWWFFLFCFALIFFFYLNTSPTLLVVCLAFFPQCSPLTHWERAVGEWLLGFSYMLC